MSDSQELFAIKEFRFKKHDESEMDYLKRITSEFSIGSCLFHENIIRTFDLFQYNNLWCIALQYEAGGDMMNYSLNHSITITETYSFFSQLLNGVRYLHQMGVAHRDLKPENCMIFNVINSNTECIKD